MANFTINKTSVPKLYRNERIYQGTYSSQNPVYLQSVAGGTPGSTETSSFAESASYAITASYTFFAESASHSEYAITASYADFAESSSYSEYSVTSSHTTDPFIAYINKENQFTGSQNISGSVTASDGLRVGNEFLDDNGQIEILGSSEAYTGGRIGGISWHNYSSPVADDTVVEMYVYETGDLNAGRLTTKVSNPNGTMETSKVQRSDIHTWYADDGALLSLGTASLFPSTDLGLDLGTPDLRFNSFHVAEFDTDILVVSESLTVASGAIMRVPDGNIWFGFNDPLAPGFIAWGDELYKSDPDPEVPIVPVTYIDVLQGETLRFNALAYNFSGLADTGIDIAAITAGGSLYRSGIVWSSPDTTFPGDVTANNFIGTASYAITASYAANAGGGAAATGTVSASSALWDNYIMTGDGGGTGIQVANATVQFNNQDISGISAGAFATVTASSGLKLTAIPNEATSYVLYYNSGTGAVTYALDNTGSEGNIINAGNTVADNHRITGSLYISGGLYVDAAGGFGIGDDLTDTIWITGSLYLNTSENTTKPHMLFYDSTTGLISYDVTSSLGVGGGGAGTVTATGTLTDNYVIVGNGTTDITTANASVNFNGQSISNVDNITLNPNYSLTSGGGSGNVISGFSIIQNIGNITSTNVTASSGLNLPGLSNSATSYVLNYDPSSNVVTYALDNTGSEGNIINAGNTVADVHRITGSLYISGGLYVDAGGGFGIGDDLTDTIWVTGSLYLNTNNSTSQQHMLYYDNSTGAIHVATTGSLGAGGGGGSGTVTNTGTLTNNYVMVGNGTTDISVADAGVNMASQDITGAKQIYAVLTEGTTGDYIMAYDSAINELTYDNDILITGAPSSIRFATDSGQLQWSGTSHYIGIDGSNNMTFTDGVTTTKTLAELAAGGGSVSFGLEDQIPITNAATNDFDYTTNLAMNGNYLFLANGLQTSTIVEGTAGVGITLDGVKLKDTQVHLSTGKGIFFNAANTSYMFESSGEIWITDDDTDMTISQLASGHTKTRIQHSDDGNSLEVALLSLGDVAWTDLTIMMYVVTAFDSSAPQIRIGTNSSDVRYKSPSDPGWTSTGWKTFTLSNDPDFMTGDTTITCRYDDSSEDGTVGDAWLYFSYVK